MPKRRAGGRVTSRRIIRIRYGILSVQSHPDRPVVSLEPAERHLSVDRRVPGDEEVVVGRETTRSVDTGPMPAGEEDA